MSQNHKEWKTKVRKTFEKTNCQYQTRGWKRSLWWWLFLTVLYKTDFSSIDKASVRLELITHIYFSALSVWLQLWRTPHYVYEVGVFPFIFINEPIAWSHFSSLNACVISVLQSLWRMYKAFLISILLQFLLCVMFAYWYLHVEYKMESEHNKYCFLKQ